jgi:choline dehydrogenase-like flavoprotein
MTGARSAERADVVVVGSGAAGAALSWRLAERGVNVVCLEQGDWIDRGALPSSRPEVETFLRRGSANFSPNARRLPQDYPVSTQGISPAQIFMFNGVGGSTVHWEGHFPRFHPSDFRMRSLDGVGADWPIRYEDLETYYDLNDRMMGTSGIAGDPANPPRAQRPHPPLALGKRGETIARGFDRLGWHWWPSDNAVLSRDSEDRQACDGRGRCNFGCPRKARASVDITYWPKAIAAGARLVTWARVREVTVDAKGRAKGVLYQDRDGALHEKLGRIVVVCGNGIGTPRLLLASKSKSFRDGIANSSGLVGKNYMVHPSHWVEGVFEERIDGHVGFTSNPCFSQEFYETDEKRGFVRGYSLVVYGPYGPLSLAWGDAQPVPWGAGHHAEMRRRWRHTVGIAIMGEDLPEETNRVELDRSAHDRNGMPAAKVTYRHGANTLKMLDHGVAMARRVLEAAGAKTILQAPGPNVFAHLMGTARMGKDPKTSVVDAWNRAHDVPNLYVVDGSSFTTSAAVNPTNTIGALALRAADGIWQKRGEWS